MTLSDRDILRELASGQLIITDCGKVGPASVDVYLGDSLAWPSDRACWYMGTDGYPLGPGEFVLATTREQIAIPDNIACQVHGCSSIGRQGLFVQNAGWVDPGFSGSITLELWNAGPTSYRLMTGDRIAQLTFAYLHSPARRPYSGRYMGQWGATPARPPKET